jgi:hypothetical protein
VRGDFRRRGLNAADNAHIGDVPQGDRDGAITAQRKLRPQGDPVTTSVPD